MNEFNIKSLEELINKVQAISELPYRDIRYQYTKDKKGSVVEDGDTIIYKIPIECKLQLIDIDYDKIFTIPRGNNKSIRLYLDDLIDIDDEIELL